MSDAITDVPNEISGAFKEGYANLTAPSNRGQQGSIEGLLNTGRAVLGAGQMMAAPITGAARSLIGHPMAQAEHAVGTIIAPDIAAKDDPKKMYQVAKGDVDLAMSALRSNGVPVSAPITVAPSSGRGIVDAADRLSAVAGPINVPQAIASDSATVQRIGQGVRNVPVVGDAIPKATQSLTDSLSGAVRTIADEYGAGSGPNVASRIGSNIGDAAAVETASANNAAARSDAALLSAWENDQRNAQQALDAANNSALARSNQSVGSMSPQDMGAELIQRLRAGEAEARANKDALYERAGNSDAAVNAGEVRNARATVAQNLENAGTVVDRELTPAASRMMDELQRLSTLEIPNKAVGSRLPASGAEEQVAVSAQGIEQARKRLNFFRSAASNDADRRAASQVMRSFDDWQSNAFENALFSGSDEALTAFRQARAANADWRNRFFNEEDDASKIVNRIVTGEITPQEVSNYIVGAGKVGAKGVSSRLLTRLAEATGGDHQAMQAIRGGIWNRLTQATEGVDQKPGARVANDILEFLHGSGRDVAQRIYSPEQQQIMRAYADTIRQTDSARDLISATAKNTKPSQMAVGPGPMQELANAVLGRGGKTDEALFSAIDSYAKSGSRGDIGTLSRILNVIPESDKGDLAGAIVRNLGISPRTNQFSPDVFVSQWKSYTPQAKALLFGNAGAHRQALDDIALISDRLKQVGQKFGNPSGTAQNANLFALAGGLISAPISTITGAVGGAVAAKILASPASAASASRWSKAYQAFATRPSPHTIGALQVASRNLANMARDLGSNVTALDFMKAAQSPSGASAKDEKNIPRPPSQ